MKCWNHKRRGFERSHHNSTDRKRATASNTEPQEIQDEVWTDIFEWRQKHFPKSGAIELPIMDWSGQAVSLMSSLK